MTIDEAREILEKLIPQPQRGDGKSITHLMITEALNMAIEVLEQQPCEDCISREDAIDVIYDYEYKKDMRKALVELPSVTPKAEWIPVSERLPEVSDHYLIQYSRHICPDEMAVAFYSVEEAELDKNYTWEFKSFGDCKEVIAWMPLPQPYKAESEEEE